MRGYRVAWGSLEAADLACRDVLARRASGEIDASFYQGNLGSFRPPERSRQDGDRVLVVAMPRPAHSVVFDLGGGSRLAIIPPTYVQYTALFDEVARDLQANALPPGSRVERAQAPLKSLAARLGLVRYGRNNLTYAPGCGTYLQLFGYVTDAPLPVPKGWRPSEPELLPTCESCTACRDACPTGAIGEDRVLLRAERCLTWLNENPGPWPAWLASDAHRCLVGCLSCQTVCPENAQLTVTDTGISFTPEETATILDDQPDHSGSAVWDAIRAKLDLIRLNEGPVLGRNLRALIASGHQVVGVLSA
jgi:epoxyqueuosine reductase